jgi:eukaryotic-like serine/threonine-protein kinase
LEYQSVKPGEVIEGRYKVIRAIADGGMGTVFLAEHWLIKRRVAIKILHAELAQDAVMIRRFMNEALAAGTLGHPNIVESTDMGFTKGNVPYIVFEYLEGTVLADEILRVREMPVARVLKIAHQIASALDAAHDADIIHRDLKTDNIFLTDRGGAHDHVKVLDFGISRFLSGSDKTVAGGNLLGTPEFMAPEQVLTPDAIDGRADIYALGIAMYEMLTGNVPFPLFKRGAMPSVEEAHALLDRIINEAPPPIRRADVPPEIASFVIDKLLAKAPNARCQTMRDVQVAIEQIASALPRPITIPPPLISAPHTRAPAPAPPPIDAISDQTVSRTELSPTELAREVQSLGKRWSLAEGDLVMDLQSRQMTRLAAAITAIAAIADELDHHPTLHLEHPDLRVTIIDAKTVLDLVFAARIEAWLRDHDW